MPHIAKKENKKKPKKVVKLKPKVMPKRKRK